MGIVAMIVVGLIAGLLARAIMPGNDSMGWIATIVLGIVGSFVGGLLASVLLHDNTANTSDFHPTGIVGSVIGALIVLGIWHFARRRRLIS
jgi:uncharacterized membrane protein YeaQ/YmgE (transglycosylase-associated protein family)